MTPEDVIGDDNAERVHNVNKLFRNSNVNKTFSNFSQAILHGCGDIRRVKVKM